MGWLIFFYATRFVAGMGIGGEYAAINSAIDEMMPARYRGRVDVRINGTYWAGSIIGSFVALFFLNTLPADVGWRVAFLTGPVLALVIIFVRRNLPESPRWLITHGRLEEAERVVAQIEAVAEQDGQHLAPVDDAAAITLKPEKQYGYTALLRSIFRQYPKRAVLGASLMITQSFLYNAIFFTYAIVLTQFYGVSATTVPIYGLAFAVGNLAGPLVLGGLFDSWGRKRMIAGTYILSGALLAVSAFLFQAGVLNALTQTAAWIVIFFFASAGASAAYLTVSEIFPIEIRAQAIAAFFALAQVAGAIGPLLYGALIGNGARPHGVDHRIPDRRRHHDRRRAGRSVPRGECRTQTVGDGHPTAHRRRRALADERLTGGGAADVRSGLAGQRAARHQEAQRGVVDGRLVDPSVLDGGDDGIADRGHVHRADVEQQGVAGGDRRDRVGGLIREGGVAAVLEHRHVIGHDDPVEAQLVAQQGVPRRREASPAPHPPPCSGGART